MAKHVKRTDSLEEVLNNMPKKTKKDRQKRRMLIFWTLSMRADAEDEYRKAVRHYYLFSDNWEEVLDKQKKARFVGVSDERLVEIDIEVMNGITDEEFREAIGDFETTRK